MQTTNPKMWKTWVVPLFVLVMGGVYLLRRGQGEI